MQGIQEQDEGTILAGKSLLFILKWGGKGARPFHVEEVKIFHSLGQACGLQRPVLACIGLRCGFETTSGQFSPIQGENFHLGTSQPDSDVYDAQNAVQNLYGTPVLTDI